MKKAQQGTVALGQQNDDGASAGATIDSWLADHDGDASGTGQISTNTFPAHLAHEALQNIAYNIEIGLEPHVDLGAASGAAARGDGDDVAAVEGFEGGKTARTSHSTIEFDAKGRPCQIKGTQSNVLRPHITCPLRPPGAAWPCVLSRVLSNQTQLQSLGKKGGAGPPRDSAAPRLEAYPAEYCPVPAMTGGKILEGLGSTFEGSRGCNRLPLRGADRGAHAAPALHVHGQNDRTS
eukprot:6269615-Pyramimonas_sp.AAC.1